MKDMTPFYKPPDMLMPDSSEQSGNKKGAMAAAIVSLILGLVYIALQIYILYYTFKLERIGCECARDFRLTYAQVYIILTFAVYVVLAILEALTDQENAMAMATAKGIIFTVMFVAGIVYVVFVWQYIERLKRIKCACSTSLARDVWEVVNYIQIALLFLSLMFAVIQILYFISVYLTYKSSTGQNTMRTV